MHPIVPILRLASHPLPATARGLVALAFAVLSVLGLGACAPAENGGEVQVRGILTEESVECQALRSEEGELYALTGDLGTIQSGDLVDVRGTLGPESACDGGIVLQVAALEVVDGPSTSGDEVTAAGNGAPVDEPAPDGQLLLEGELTDEGVECQAFRSDDGALYTFSASVELDDLGPGDRVRIVGTPVDVSTCMQGQTLDVVEVGLVEEGDA